MDEVEDGDNVVVVNDTTDGVTTDYWVIMGHVYHHNKYILDHRWMYPKWD